MTRNRLLFLLFLLLLILQWANADNVVTPFVVDSIKTSDSGVSVEITNDDWLPKFDGTAGSEHNFPEARERKLKITFTEKDAWVELFADAHNLGTYSDLVLNFTQIDHPWRLQLLREKPVEEATEVEYEVFASKGFSNLEPKNFEKTGLLREGSNAYYSVVGENNGRTLSDVEWNSVRKIRIINSEWTGTEVEEEVVDEVTGEKTTQTVTKYDNVLELRSSYYYKPTTLNFSDYDAETGAFTIPWSQLKGHLQITNHNGELTIADNGTITAIPAANTDKDGRNMWAELSLDICGLDFSAVRRIQIAHIGGDTNGYKGEGTESEYFFRRMVITDIEGKTVNYDDNNGAFWSSQYNLSYTTLQKYSGKMGRITWFYEPFIRDAYGNEDNSTMYKQERSTTTTMRMLELGIMVDVIRSEAFREIPLTNVTYGEWTGSEGIATMKTSDVFMNNFKVGVKLTKNKDIVYGKRWLTTDNYCDITGYDEIRVRGNARTPVQLLLNRTGNNNGEVIIMNGTIAENGYYAFKLSEAMTAASEKSQNFLHLNCIRVGGDSSSNPTALACDGSDKGSDWRISNITLFKDDNKIDYYISGKVYKGNVQTHSMRNALTALETNTAMNIDGRGLRITSESISGLTDKKLSLDTKNPNCLIWLNDDSKNLVSKKQYSAGTTLSENFNIVTTEDNGTTWSSDNILLTDKTHPFFSPYNINNVAKAELVVTPGNTPTYPSYTDYGTLCLPFTMPVPDTFEAYEATSNVQVKYNEELGKNSRYLQMNKVDEITSNRPVIIKMKQNGQAVLSATNTSINATDGLTNDDSSNGRLVGTYLGATVDEETGESTVIEKFTPPYDDGTSWILQKKSSEGLAFYPVAGTNAYIRAFRCYLHYDELASGSSNAKGLIMMFNDFDDVTGINEVTLLNDKGEITNDGDPHSTYNIAGSRIYGKQRGLNIVRMSDGIVRKVVVK